MARPKKEASQTSLNSFLEKVQTDLNDNQSLVSVVLGVLVLVVVGVLLFNYFNKSSGELGSSQQTFSADEDVKKENLPGKYTVKEGDTLFVIAQNYYDDGYNYPKLVDANKLANPDFIEVGQVLEIPKLDSEPEKEPSSNTTTLNAQAQSTDQATGGAINETIWGERIAGDTYTVQAGDWLSKIAGRAYGDIFAFEKLAKANDITNPDNIEPGTTLKIPR